MHAWCPDARRGTGSPGPGVTNGCESPLGSWEPKLSPQQEQVLLSTKPLLQPDLVLTSVREADSSANAGTMVLP